MKNTLENKAQFFTQYIGAFIEISDKEDYFFRGKLTGIRKEDQSWKVYFEDSPKFNFVADLQSCKIGLKPVLRLIEYNRVPEAKNEFLEIKLKFKLASNELTQKYLRSLLNKNFGSGSHNRKDELCVSEVCKFLLKRGFAIPYCGASVEQQIDWGWIKLKGKFSIEEVQKELNSQYSKIKEEFDYLKKEQEKEVDELKRKAIQASLVPTAQKGLIYLRTKGLVNGLISE